MDAEIFNKYKEGTSPFDGETIHTPMPEIKNLDRLKPFYSEKAIEYLISRGSMPLVNLTFEQLKHGINIIFKFLSSNNLIDEIYTCDDWLEHDGCLLKKHLISSEFLQNFLESDNEFNNISWDDYVRKGFFDNKSRWYLRVYINHSKLMEDIKHYYGNFDITLNSIYTAPLKKLLEQELLTELEISKPSKYFDRIIYDDSLKAILDS